MTKEEAKKALEEDLPKVSQFSPKMASAYKVAISALKGGEWIPVTERLPEERHTYEVTLQGIGELEGIDNEVAYATWFGNKNNRKNNWLYHDVNNWQDKEVIAWKPRSKPYKVESEEV